MTEKFREMRNFINYLKKRNLWNPEDADWAKAYRDEILFNKFKTKQIGLNEFINESINSLINQYETRETEYKNGGAWEGKPTFNNALVPTWYEWETKETYVERMICWFIACIVFVGSDNCDEEMIQVYNDFIEYRRLNG